MSHQMDYLPAEKYAEAAPNGDDVVLYDPEDPDEQYIQGRPVNLGDMA